jgi:hypothetical protein
MATALALAARVPSDDDPRPVAITFVISTKPSGKAEAQARKPSISSALVGATAAHAIIPRCRPLAPLLGRLFVRLHPGRNLRRQLAT